MHAFRSASEREGHKRSFHRSPASALQVVVGLGLFFAMALQIEGDSAGPLELDVFRALNDLPEIIATALWLPMQYGNFVVIPVLAVVAAFLRQWRLMGALLLIGVGKYLGARVVKGEIQRHRPNVFLDDVRLGMGSSDSGLGFVSGHAVVAVAVAVVVYPYVRSTKWKVALIVAAVIVCAGRVLVGAHLPMDVVGGAGIGLIIGGLANLVMGIPRPEPEKRTTEVPIPAEA